MRWFRHIFASYHFEKRWNELALNNNIGPEEIAKTAISTTRGKIGHLAEDTAVWSYIDPRVLWICTKRYILSNQDNYDL